MAIGEEFASEIIPAGGEGGRVVEQLTAASANSYPLYYFVPSMTADGRYLVVHSERGGRVQLYRMDFDSGRIVQLTDGRTADSGWAMWCERRLDGIYNHLSALNVVTDEVIYFQDDEVRAAQVRTLENRRVARLPQGRMPIGQSDCSPDGRLLAFIHAEEKTFRPAQAEREARMASGRWTREDRDAFRERLGGIVLATIELATGRYREVAARDFHFHHVLFLDQRTLLVNHPRGCAGMWTVRLDDAEARHLRPHTHPDAHGAAICHQVITDNGILYEANSPERTWLGRYRPGDDTWIESPLPVSGYIHVGRDPAGRMAFIERSGDGVHELMHVTDPSDPEAMAATRLRLLRPGGQGQRHHAHPWLTPDRRWMIFTDRDEAGFAQVFRMDVSDLAVRHDGWPTK